MIYLDNAATTALDPEVLKVIEETAQIFGNPSSIHQAGRKARTIIEESRKKIASFLHCSPGEIFFTSGGTEADNWAIFGVLHKYPIKAIITSPIEHHAVLHTVEYWAQEKKIPLYFVNLLPDGHVDLDHLEDLLKKNAPAFVSLMHGNNEIGNITSIKKTGELCKKYGAFFHSDTVQTIGHFYFELNDLPVDYITCAAHKIHGPKGIGFLYVNNEALIPPMILGGAQERGMRSGTENVIGIAALAKAFEISQANRDKHLEHLKTLKKYFVNEIQKLPFEIAFNGDVEGKSLPQVVNVRFPKHPFPDAMIYRLDMNGVCASGGSACSSGSQSQSHVLKAIGVDPACPSVRFSFSHHTTLEELQNAIEIIFATVKDMYDH